MSSNWQSFRLRVTGVEQVMLETDGVVYTDNNWFAGCALAALCENHDDYGDVASVNPDSYSDWVSFEAKETDDGIWIVKHDGERVGAEQNLDEAVAHACSLPRVDLDPWDP